MKHLSVLLLILVFTTTHISAQKTAAAASNASGPIQPENLVSTAGIGPFKLGMTKTAVEKVLNTRLKRMKYEMDKTNYEPDTISVKYKGTDVDLVFGYNSTPTDTVTTMRIYDIRSGSALMKTRSGIAIGDDKMKIVTTYTQYRLDIIPDYDKALHPKNTDIYLYDNNAGSQLIFHLYDNLVMGFEVTFNEGD